MNDNDEDGGNDDMAEGTTSTTWQAETKLAALERRWEDARKAWSAFNDAVAEKKRVVSGWNTKIKACEDALATRLREEKPEGGARAAYEEVCKLQAKIDKHTRARDSAKLRLGTEVESRRMALEMLLEDDRQLSLPLPIADVSVVTDIHIKGTLLLVGQIVHLKGEKDPEAALTVFGFRTKGKGKRQVEVVVCKNVAGEEVECIPGDLVRVGEAPEVSRGKPLTELAGFALHDRVKHKSSGSLGNVDGFGAGKVEIVVLWDEADVVTHVDPNNLVKIPNAKAHDRNGHKLKLGEYVMVVPDDYIARVVELSSELSIIVRKDDGTMATVETGAVAKTKQPPPPVKLPPKKGERKSSKRLKLKLGDEVLDEDERDGVIVEITVLDTEGYALKVGVRWKGADEIDHRDATGLRRRPRGERPKK